MRPSMDYQCLPIPGSIATQFAHEVSLIAVDAPMGVEIVLIHEGLAAVFIIAFELSNPRMTLYVTEKGARALKDFGAYFTLEFCVLLTSVLLQSPVHVKSGPANIAFESLWVRMAHPEVGIQVLLGCVLTIAV